MNNLTASPKDIEIPENFTGKITIDNNIRKIIYEFINIMQI